MKCSLSKMKEYGLIGKRMLETGRSSSKDYVCTNCCNLQKRRRKGMNLKSISRDRWLILMMMEELYSR